MEVQASDSKKLFKVFDASKRKRGKQKGPDDSNSVATNDSNNALLNIGRVISDRLIAQKPIDKDDGVRRTDSVARRKSSHSIASEEHRSPRRHRRQPREQISLALKSGAVSTPRSVSPTGEEMFTEHPSQDQDSLIYAFLEEAIKRDKKKHRHSRKCEEQHCSKEREHSGSRERRRRHRHRHRDAHSREKNKHREESASPNLNQAALLETFAKICAQITEKQPVPVARTQSHKSLQCEVLPQHDLRNSEHYVERGASHERLRESTPTRRHSQDRRRPSEERLDSGYDRRLYHRINPKVDYETNYDFRLNYPEPKKSTKINDIRSRVFIDGRQEDRYRSCRPPENVATRTYIGSGRDHSRGSEEEKSKRDLERKRYEDERKRYVEQKTSRSFDTYRDGYEDERCRRTSRSDTKYKQYADRRYDRTAVEDYRHLPKERPRRLVDQDRFDRNSVVSQEEYPEKDSERERDSVVSVADGDTCTLSGRTAKSHYMKAVKQEIAEQREAMDKMMKLWKDLMRCFKGISQDKDKSVMNESACEQVRESAATQLRLWRECMQRYHTVARDVGDTDARLMEEINKQRSEMSEMASMWQECLQRYRDMTHDFNALKQKLVKIESPTRLPAETATLAESERVPPVPVSSPPYNLSQIYSQMPANLPAGYPCGGSPLRGRASAPPAWWWGAEHPPRRRSSRRSSPDSRDGRDRDHDRDRRHRTKDARDSSRHKDKSSKPSAARSEHRRRKR